MSKRKPTAEEVVDDLTRLLAESRPVQLEPSDITLKRVCDKGVSVNVARRLIAEWVTAGKVRAVGKRRAANGSLVDAWVVVKK